MSGSGYDAVVDVDDEVRHAPLAITSFNADIFTHISYDETNKILRVTSDTPISKKTSNSTRPTSMTQTQTLANLPPVAAVFLRRSQPRAALAHQSASSGA
jgi:hypothetical protein